MELLGGEKRSAFSQVKQTVSAKQAKLHASNHKPLEKTLKTNTLNISTH